MSDDLTNKEMDFFDEMAEADTQRALAAWRRSEALKKQPPQQQSENEVINQPE